MSKRGSVNKLSFLIDAILASVVTPINALNFFNIDKVVLLYDPYDNS